MAAVVFLELPKKSYFSLNLPIGGKILDVRLYGTEVHMFVLSPMLYPITRELRKRNFVVLETAESSNNDPEKLNYIATFKHFNSCNFSFLFEEV